MIEHTDSTPKSQPLAAARAAAERADARIVQSLIEGERAYLTPDQRNAIRDCDWRDIAELAAIEGSTGATAALRAIAVRDVARASSMLSTLEHVRNGDDADDDDDDDHDAPSCAAWPDPLGPAALYGLAGEFVRLVLPETESDAPALLLQFLLAFGNIAGRSAFIPVEGDRHYANEFMCLVGDTSSGRKGTSFSRVRRLFELASEGFRSRLPSGLSSGEGLLFSVRDPIMQSQPIKKNGLVDGYQDVTVDPGVSDKRSLVYESEFGRCLRVSAREGNTLSAIIRSLWDSGNACVLTKSPYKTTDAHVSIIAHITAEELANLLTRCDASNGLANRFLWVCSRRSKELPFGGHVPDLNRLAGHVAAAAAAAAAVDFVLMDENAKELWASRYHGLTTSASPGVLGAIVGRAAPHVLRLALIYALLDCRNTIGREHLVAALEVWRYCEQSARFVFGESLGDSDAEQLLAALQTAPGGMSKTAIANEVFGKHKSSATINGLLASLHRAGRIRPVTESTSGRSKTIWLACT